MKRKPPRLQTLIVLSHRRSKQCRTSEDLVRRTSEIPSPSLSSTSLFVPTHPLYFDFSSPFVDFRFCSFLCFIFWFLKKKKNVLLFGIIQVLQLMTCSPSLISMEKLLMCSFLETGGNARLFLFGVNAYMRVYLGCNCISWCLFYL